MAVAYHNRQKFNVIEAFFKGKKLNRLYVGKELLPWKLKDESGGGGVLSYYGQATGLKGARSYLAGASVGNYALFAGGYEGHSYLNIVDAYDSNLIRTTPTALSEARMYLVGASVGNYALFAGGYPITDTVDVYQVA